MDLKLKLVYVMVRDVVELKVVFILRERKINNFLGKWDSDIIVDEFIEDIEFVLKIWLMLDIEKVNFIISYLEGLVREEVCYRLIVEKKKLKDILDIFREVFGDRGIIFEFFLDFY